MIRIKNKLIISLMGVDGAGKTTLAKKLNKIFTNSKYLHLKPYILFKDRRTVVKNPHDSKKSSFILSLFRILSWLVSYKFYFKNKRKTIYFFDRYAHDILIDPIRYKHGLSKKLTILILNFFPRPDLWIFLKPSLKTVKSRKQELSDNELKKQIKDYTKFFKNQKNVLTLNTSVQKKILIQSIKKKIKYYKK
jgi:thymidylate kinase